MAEEVPEVGETGPPVASAEEVSQMKEIFRKFDQNGDKKLSRRELGRLLKAMPSGENLSERDMDIVFMTADKNDNGAIECDEFIDYIFQAKQDRRSTRVIGDQGAEIEGLQETMKQAGFEELIPKMMGWAAPARLKTAEDLFEDLASLERLCDFLELTTKERRKLRMTYATLNH